MALVVLLILLALWAIVIVPPIVRARHERTVDTIGDFSFRLGALGGANGSADAPPPTGTPGRGRSVGAVGAPSEPLVAARTPGYDPAARRRRDVCTALGVAVAVTLLAAVASGGVLWTLHLMTWMAFATYGGLWVWYRHVEPRRYADVHHLPRRELRPLPAPSGLRRSFGS